MEWRISICDKASGTRLKSAIVVNPRLSCPQSDIASQPKNNLKGPVSFLPLSDPLKNIKVFVNWTMHGHHSTAQLLLRKGAVPNPHGVPLSLNPPGDGSSRKSCGTKGSEVMEQPRRWHNLLQIQADGTDRKELGMSFF